MWGLALQFLSLAVPLAIQMVADAHAQRIRDNAASSHSEGRDQAFGEIEKKVEELKKIEE